MDAKDIDGRPAQDGEISFRTEREGRAFIALRVRDLPSRCSGSRLNEMMTEPGYIAEPLAGESPSYAFTEWKLERREISEGAWTFMGPDFPGKSLFSLLSGVDSEESAAVALAALERLSYALVSFSKARIKAPIFFSSSVLVGDAGRLLFLPGSLSRGCIDHARPLATEFERTDADVNRHPSQFLAEALRDAVIRADGGLPDSRAQGLPLSSVAPRLHPALLSSDDAFRKRTGAYPVERWAKAFASASGSFFAKAEAGKLDGERARKAKALERAGRVEGLKAFMKRGRPFLFPALGLALLALLIVPPVLKSRTEARRFIAYSPERIVAAYYAAYSTVNDQDLELCGAKGALKEDIQVAVNMTAFLKVRQATEGRDPRVDADAWLKAGKPPIRPGDYLYGITDFQLETAGTAEAPAFRASYYLWNTIPAEGIDGGAEYVRSQVSDELSLVRTSLGWKISARARRAGPPEPVTPTFRE